MLHNHVISLSNAHTRRSHIRQEFGRQQIPFRFFDALTPSPQLDQTIARLLPNLALTRRTGGEQACFASHLSLWEQCIQEDLPYIGIFEDDILLGNGAGRFLCQDSWLPERFPASEAWVLRLETFLMKIKSRPASVPPHGRYRFLHPDTIHYGTAGYIISRAAAEQLLHHILPALPPEELDAVDMLLFGTLLADPRLTIYQLTPTICVQEPQYRTESSQMPSQLQTERFRLQMQLAAESPAPHKTLRQRLTHALTKLSREREKRRYRTIPFDTP